MEKGSVAEEWTYWSSVVSIELVILTQGFNWYNHRNQPLIAGYGMMTPQETNNGMAIAELNNIPTYKNFRSRSAHVSNPGGKQEREHTWMDGAIAPTSWASVTPKNSVKMIASNMNPVPSSPEDP